MTLDAMHWVWNHSQSKGNTRIALLYVADQVRTLAAEVRVGQRELSKALNTASKGTAEEAVRRAIQLGELEVLEAGSGRRPALYRLPKAAGYVRPTSASAPETGAQNLASAPESGAQDPEGTPRSAPKTGAQENGSAPVFDASAPKTGAPPHTQTTQAASEAGRPDAFQIIQPLIHAMTNAGITVSWSMQAKDMIDIATIVQRAGVDAMVTFARDTKASSRQPVRYATFFLRGGWRGLPPASKAPPPRNNQRNQQPWCEDPDCDPETRTRDIENDKGLRFSDPCPKCHPSRKESAA
ncbi:hypothetical protein ABZ312_11595 [Streptomyces sp. NPDC006207]